MSHPETHDHLAVTLVLVLATNFLIPSTSATEFTVWHVYVVNELASNAPLLVHCKSKDDDLGIRNVWPGNNFTWGFREQFFQRTLFWCYVRKDDWHATFNVFRQDVYLFYKCSWKSCIWVAKDDGIYIRDLDQGQDELRYNWEPGRKKT